MDVNVLLPEKVWIDAVALAVRARPGERRGHRFLHDFAEMPGHGELLAAAHARRFDENDVAAYRRPNEPDGHSGSLDAFLDLLLRAKFRHAQEFADHFRRYDHLFHLAFGDPPRLFARDGSDFALQVAHACLTREAVDDFLQALVCELDLFPNLQAVLRGLFRNQVPMRDVELLFSRVAGQFDDLHAISQRLGDGLPPGGLGDEQHFRELVRHFQIEISERMVLLRVAN